MGVVGPLDGWLSACLLFCLVAGSIGLLFGLVGRVVGGCLVFCLKPWFCGSLSVFIPYLRTSAGWRRMMNCATYTLIH